jgi:hypothetical protein
MDFVAFGVESADFTGVGRDARFLVSEGSGGRSAVVGRVEVLAAEDSKRFGRLVGRVVDFGPFRIERADFSGDRGDAWFLVLVEARGWTSVVGRVEVRPAEDAEIFGSVGSRVVDFCTFGVVGACFSLGRTELGFRLLTLTQPYSAHPALQPSLPRRRSSKLLLKRALLLRRRRIGFVLDSRSGCVIRVDVSKVREVRRS